MINQFYEYPTKYPFLLGVYLLGVLVLAILNAFIGRFSNKPFTIKDLRISLFALIVTHIQLLIGLILYFVSPRFSAWQEGMGAVMGDSTLRCTW